MVRTNCEGLFPQLATLNDLDEMVRVLLEYNADPLAKTEVCVHVHVCMCMCMCACVMRTLPFTAWEDCSRLCNFLLQTSES